MTFHGAHTETVTGNQEARVEIWYLLAPSSSGGEVVVALKSGAVEAIAAGATTFCGVDQTTPLGAFQYQDGANQSTEAPFVGIVSAADELVYSVIAWEHYVFGTDVNSLTVNSPSTTTWAHTIEDRVKGAAATAPGDAMVNVTYTTSNANAINVAGYVIGAVSLKPATGSGGSTTCNTTIADDFSSGTYSGGTGAWVSDWTEVNNGGSSSDPDGPTAGDISIDAERLRFHGQTTGNSAFIARVFDLTDATVATVTANLSGIGIVAGTDEIRIRLSADGGTTWSFTQTIGLSNLGVLTMDLLPYASANTTISIGVSEGTNNPGVYFYLDDFTVNVTATCTNTGENLPADYLISTLDGQTTNTCTGVFADSGDTNANYSDNESFTTTFCSDLNNHISFTFNHFNTEAGSDILNIYDGNTTGATLIGAYSGFGSANSPGIVTSSETCLTFEFVANASINSVGWQAIINCTGSIPTGTAGAVWNGYPTNNACSVSEQIGGFVFEDFNNDGTKDINEAPIKGVDVEIFDDNGPLGTVVTTDENGEYVFDGLNPSTVYRIEFSVSNGMHEGVHGTASGTAVQFVESGRCTANLGLFNPNHYCNETNPLWVIPCYANGDPQHSSNVGTTGVARFEYNDSGDSPTSTYLNYISIDQVGTVWGIAQNSEVDELYMSTILKRHAGLGPAGIGAIYAHQNDGPAIM